jgi:hypothetical protein
MQRCWVGGLLFASLALRKRRDEPWRLPCHTWSWLQPMLALLSRAKATVKSIRHMQFLIGCCPCMRSLGILGIPSDP